MSDRELHAVYTQRAQHDLVNIQLYGLGTWGESGALTQQKRILSAIDLLCRNPLMGRPRAERAGLRSFVSKPYVIFYVVSEDEIVVQTILHHNMDLQRIIESSEAQ
ncbi:MAG: type II toxin-antitoxin system RelE/ParE family toxin [Thermomicrobiales bacterium]